MKFPAPHFAVGAAVPSQAYFNQDADAMKLLLAPDAVLHAGEWGMHDSSTLLSGGWTGGAAVCKHRGMGYCFKLS